MSNNIKVNTSFWDEISEYRIQVPYYQRDYAQGRIDNGRINNIRKVFVEELYGALNSPKTCHLGLVFGSYSEEEKMFIAVDGQQRLTTVFLFHWYIALHENKLNDYKEKLLKFSWDTRSYSSQFVKLLFKIQPSNNIIETIKSHCDYFSIWENDPTVKGMLTMIKEIENQYPHEECDLCNKLFVDTCNIQYDILKLEKDSDGKTYLKMNSRGRSLTTFELFKSKFIGDYNPGFSRKFDNEWLNFMLKMSKVSYEQFSEPDIQFMNFINEFAYLILKSNVENSQAFDESKKLIEAKIDGQLTDIPFVNFELYKKAFDNNDVRSILEKLLDWIVNNYDDIKRIDDELSFDNSMFLDEIIKNKPTFSDRVKLFSLFKYAELTSYRKLEQESYKKWNRVFRNLVENTNIDASNIGSICVAINKIDNSDIYEYLSNGGEITAFSKEQVAEEIIKAIKGQTWENILIEAEKCEYLKGKVWVLFQNKEATTMEQFEKRYQLLDEILKKQDEYYLPKILISYYHNKKPQIRLDLKKNNWKTLLTDEKRGLFDCFHKINSNIINPNIEHQWIRDISQTKLLNNSRSGGKIISSYGQQVVLWGTSGCKRYVFANEVWGNVIIGKHRTILVDGKFELQYPNIVVEGTNFVSFFDINFKYKNHFFQWWGSPNEIELDVYLMKDEWEDYKKRKPIKKDKGTDEDKFYCFRVNNKTTVDSFKKNLDSLIFESKSSGA